MSSLPYTYPSSPLSRKPSPLSPSSIREGPTQSIHPALLLQAREKKKMSLDRTYSLARTARAKLSAEASKHNHDLRLLVGHANLLDSLMIALTEAERAQEQWFNEVIRGNMVDEEVIEDDVEEEYYDEDEEEQLQQQRFSAVPSSPQWIPVDYDSDSDSESDLESEVDSDDEMEFEYHISSSSAVSPARTKTSHSNGNMLYQTIIGVNPVAEEEDVEHQGHDDEDQDGLYTLKRTRSHRPPQLVEDDSEGEDEESNPPSPPQVLLATFPKQEKDSIPTSGFFEELPRPPRLPATKVHEPYFRSEYYRGAPTIDSY